MQSNVQGHLNDTRFSVGDCQVHPASHLVERDGTAIRVEPKTMELLLCLAERAGEVVRREALEERLWPHAVVGYDALTQVVAKLRRALGDHGRRGRLIETVSKSGYRLAATLEIPQGKPTADPTQAPGTLLPSVLVLPFNDLDGGTETERFANGLTDELITDLACCPDLRVIARNSSFYFKGKPRIVQEVAAELGVCFVVEGSVRQAGGKVRVTVQLVDGFTGHGLWADRFDEASNDPFTLQDAIRKRLVSALVGEEGLLRQSDARRAWAKQAASLDEHDYYLRVHDLIFRFTREAMAEARAIAREGLAIYPGASLVRIKLGWTHMLDARFGWSADPQRDIALALELADEGLADVHLHTYGQAVGHWLRAYAVLLHLRDYDQAVAEARLACALAPNDIDLLTSCSLVLVYAGEAEQARALILKAMDLGVRTPSFFNRFLGWTYFHQGRDAEAAECARQVTTVSAETLRMQAVCFVSAGQLDQARRAVARLRELDPALSLARLRAELPYRNPADLERELVALRTAGLPALAAAAAAI